MSNLEERAALLKALLSHLVGRQISPTDIFIFLPPEWNSPYLIDIASANRSDCRPFLFIGQLK